MTAAEASHPQPVLELGPEASSPRAWIRATFGHSAVLWVLARKDFQTRYKRASLGVLWAIALPILQAAVMIFVFSHFIHTSRGVPYAPFVLSGILFWSYFSFSLPAGVTSIVDNSSLTDKLWFPRAILPVVPCVSGLVGLGVSIAVLLIAGPLLDAHVGLNLLMLIPACLLLIAFTVALSLLLSALQVYFRDVRFVTLAALTVWLYATPIMYPQSSVGSLGPWLDFNPMTGVVTLCHIAVVGYHGASLRAILVSVASTLVLLAIGVEAQRRHDRLFVDLL